MISKRSIGLASAAVFVLTLSSCLSSGSSEQHAAAVQDSSSHAFTSSSSFHEPEYFEGTTPPASPALLVEQRPSSPSAAHVWVAGEHTRRDGQWVWSPGHYTLPPSADVVWVPGHWVAHLRGYVWIGGAWR